MLRLLIVQIVSSVYCPGVVVRVPDRGHRPQPRTPCFMGGHGLHYSPNEHGQLSEVIDSTVPDTILHHDGQRYV